MTAINNWIDPLVHPATSALIHFVWQGAAIAVLLAVILLLQRRCQPVVRYRTACLALAVMVALPVVTFLKTDVTPSPNFAFLAATETVGEISDATVTEARDNEKPAVTSTLLANATFRSWVFLLWLFGVIGLATVHVIGFRRTLALRTQNVRAASAEWNRIVDELTGRMGIRRAVRVLQSAVVEVPTVVGWLSPVVLVPAGAFVGMSSEQLRYILAHELAHVRRSDYLLNLFQVAAETLLFFHPAVWWVSGQIRQEREHCCDDLAATFGGNRREYAQALLTLETARSQSHRYVMQATNGSLIHRIRRMLGGNAMFQLNRPSLAGAMLAIALVTGVSVIGVTVKSADGADAKPADPITQTESDAKSGGTFAEMEDRFTEDGRWYMEENDGSTHLNIRTGKRNNRWTMGRRVSTGDFTGLSEGRDVEFELRSEAGTFYFQGDVERDGKAFDGDGDFGFVPNNKYRDDMAKLGVRGIDKEHFINFAFQDVGTQYVRDLKKIGYAAPSGDDLFKLAIHGVSIDYIESWRKRGYENLDLDEFVKMRIHGVSVEFADEMERLGFENPSRERLVKWRIHGVSPTFVREMKDAGFRDLSNDQLVKMRIHGVTPEFVQEMKDAGFKELSGEQLVKMRIHGVSPKFVTETAALGYNDMSLNELVKWRIHGVSAKFIDGMKEAGYDDISSNELVKMRIHGVSPKFVRTLGELGYDDLSVNELVKMRIHGVSPSFIRRLQKKGHEDLSVNDLIKIKIHGIKL